MGTRKVAISIPEELYDDAEAYASEMQVNRSRLYSLALAAFLSEHRDELVTERMNDVYSKPERPDEIELRKHTKAYHRRLLEGQWR